MTSKELKKLIDSLSCDIEFSYNGIDGSICPFSRTNISVSYGNEEQTCNSINEVFEVKLFDGKSLDEIVKDINVY